MRAEWAQDDFIKQEKGKVANEGSTLFGPEKLLTQKTDYCDCQFSKKTNSDKKAKRARGSTTKKPMSISQTRLSGKKHRWGL